MNKKTVRDVEVKGKKCLVRVDFNVPMKTVLLPMKTELTALYQPLNTLWKTAQK